MRRFRFATALLLAVSFLASPGGVLAARVCPHHDGPASAAAAESHDVAYAGSHAHETAPAYEAGAAVHAPEAGTEPAGHDDGCSCLGACTPSAALALLSAALVLAAVDHATEATPVPVSESTPRPRLLPHVLPFANAPPVLSIG